MPKIVDHDAYRQKLAQQAAILFSEKGYSALGMRQLATALGISKSALYHYFPNKEQLFEAATIASLAQFEGAAWQLSARGSNASTALKIRGLTEFFHALTDIFPNELSLVVDYLRAKSPEQVRGSRAMAMANRHFLFQVEQIVGRQKAAAVLAALYGVLLSNHMLGQPGRVDELKIIARALLA